MYFLRLYFSYIVKFILGLGHPFNIATLIIVFPYGGQNLGKTKS
jgi:hypothetical protein